MATVRYFNSDSTYWNVASGNLIFASLFGSATEVWLLDPTVFQSNGISKSTLLTKADTNTYLRQVYSANLSVTSADFLDTAWVTNGWTPGTPSTFLAELRSFVNNNLLRKSINPTLSDVNVYVMQGVVGGSAHSLAFAHYSNQVGSTLNPVVLGNALFTDVSFANTYGGAQFTDVSFDNVYTGGQW